MNDLKRQAGAKVFAAAALVSVCLAGMAWAGPTQADVFKSIQENVGSSSDVDSSKLLLYGCLAGGVVILLALFSQRQTRQAAPRLVNHQGRLLKEVVKSLPVKPREIKQLKLLAEQTRSAQGGSIKSPLTLLLTPSTLRRAVFDPRCKADRRVLEQVLRRIHREGATPATPAKPAAGRGARK